MHHVNAVQIQSRVNLAIPRLDEIHVPTQQAGGDAGGLRSNLQTVEGCKGIRVLRAAQHPRIIRGEADVGKLDTVRPVDVTQELLGNWLGTLTERYRDKQDPKKSNDHIHSGGRAVLPVATRQL